MAVASVLNLRAFCTPFLVEEEGMAVRRKLIKFFQGFPAFWLFVEFAKLREGLIVVWTLSFC